MKPSDHRAAGDAEATAPAERGAGACLGRLAAVWPMLVLAAGLLATAWVCAALERAERRAQQLQFDRHVERVQTEVKRRLAQPVEALHGARGLLAALPTHRPGALEAYASSRRLAESYPGLRGLGWFEARPAPQRRGEPPPMAQWQLREWVAGPSLPPPGWDIGSDASLSPVLERAIGNRTLSVSPYLTGGHPLMRQPGYFLVLPIYAAPRAALPAATSPAPPASQAPVLRGLLLAALAVEPALDGVFSAADGQLDIELFDGDELQRSPLIYALDAHLNGRQPQADAYAGRLHQQRVVIPFGDRPLTLQLSSIAQTHALSAWWVTAAIWIGVLLSCLMALLVAMLLQSQRAIETRSQALARDVQRLALVAQHTGNAVHIADRQGALSWVNAAWSRLFELSEASAQGRSADRLARHFVQPEPWVALLAAAARGTGGRARLCIKVSDGSTRWQDVELQPLLDDDGVCQGHIFIATDVTDLLRAAEALALERTQLAGLLEYTQAGVIVMDLRTRQLRVDEAFGRQLGLNAEQAADLEFKDLMALLHPESRRWLKETSARLISGEIIDMAGQLMARHADGRWVTSLLRARASLRDDQGQALMIVSTHVDISEQVHSAQRWRSRAEMSSDWFWQTDPWHRFCNLSESSAGQSPDFVASLAGRRRDELTQVEPPEGGWAAFHEKLDRHEPFNALAYRAPDVQGELRWVEIDGRPRFDESGAFLGYEGVGRDIQARHESTEQLQRSLALVDALFDAVPVPLAVKNVDGIYTRFNQAFAQALGIAHDTHHCVSVEQLTDQAAAQLHQEVDQQLLTRGGRMEYEVSQQLHNGPRLDHWISKAALLDGNGRPYGLVAAMIDVTAQRKSIRLMEEARSAAESANQAKSNFLAAMSHEIRTPMNGVLGMAELLLHANLPPQEQDTLQTLHRSARRLLRILDSILDFSKIEAQCLEVEREWISPAELVNDIVKAQHAAARANQVEVTLETDPALPAQQVGDGLRISQVLGNLLSNAIKFSAPAKGGGGQVRVRCAQDGSQWLLEVSDNGIGMAPETLQRLFSPFMQAEASTTRRFGGTGLGLAICKGLVALMDGAISFSSAPGQGSVFQVRLPQVWAPTSSPDTCSEQTAAERAVPAAEPSVEALSATLGAQRLRLLVAEDDPTNRLVIERQLALIGFDAVLAHDGRQALQLWREQAFAAVITDMHMPGADGCELARMLREEELERGLPRTPILVLSANLAESEVLRARQAGIDDYLTKPIALAQLQQALQRWLKRGPDIEPDIDSSGDAVANTVDTVQHAALQGT